MKASPAVELRAYVAHLQLRGLSSAAVHKIQNRCEEFIRFCREHKALPDDGLPSIAILREHALSFWTKLEAEPTVVGKMSMVIAFCRWLARKSPPTTMARYKKLSAKQLVAKLPARYPNRR